MTATDHELLLAWRDGDTNAGQEFVRRHYGSVYRFLSSKVEDQVEDLTQRTFLACLEGRGALREAASLRPYLLGIARHLLVDAFRAHRKAGTRQEIANMPLAELGTPSVVAAVREEERTLLQALYKLPLDHQIALELHYWEEMSVPEIACVLEVPEGTIKSRLSRARAALRKHIEEAEVSEALRRSTLENLETWARSLRASLDEGDSG